MAAMADPIMADLPAAVALHVTVFNQATLMENLFA